MNEVERHRQKFHMIDGHYFATEREKQDYLKTKGIA
jgi:hypothetical protein